MKRGDLIRYWRKSGGSARAYWLDESDGKGRVRIRPVAPENTRPVWVDIEDVYDDAGVDVGDGMTIADEVTAFCIKHIEEGRKK